MENQSILYDMAINHLINVEGIFVDWDSFFQLYRENQTYLYQVYENVEKKESIVDEVVQVTFQVNNEMVIIKHQNFTLEVERVDLLKAIQLFVDMMAPMYPLGTVVDLKKEYLHKLVPTEKLANARFVIVQRFLFSSHVPAYTHFGGLVYPFGFIGGGELFYFTPELIEKVVYPGYADNIEQSYEITMKQELIINQGYCSIVFATSEVKNAFQERLRRMRRGANRL